MKKKLIKKSATVKPKIVSNEIIDEIKQEIKQEIIVELPKEEIIQKEILPNDIITMDSSTMLNDLMSETDKDNEPEQEQEDYEDIETENYNTSTDEIPTSKINALGDKLTDTLQNDNNEWQNPTDFKKTCAVNAMMYVEAGAILVSFLGQLISGDWSSESENKYLPSEERRKLIRAPLAKKFELNKNKEAKTPMSALITAILFTIIPIILIAFKDRKKRKELELKTLENNKLRSELKNANSQIENLKQPEKIKKIIGKRGRHKKDCTCEKCLSK